MTTTPRARSVRTVCPTDCAECTDNELCEYHQGVLDGWRLLTWFADHAARDPRRCWALLAQADAATRQL